jgi:RND family efflux transporter MFP subunit
MKEAATLEVVSVAVEYPQRKMVRDKLVATGTIAAKQTSAIGPLVEGVVEKILVRVGDRVKKGQALFQTRTIDFVRRIDEIEAGISVAEAETAKTQRDLDRISELVRKGLAATATEQDAKTNLNIALARLAQIRTTLLAAQQSFTDTVVRAPFDGAITARYVDEGTYMSNRFSGMGSSSVVQIQECEIAAAILFTPEDNLSKLHLGYSGQLFVAANDMPIESEILIINDRVDPVARTAEFRMAFVNPDCRIKAGQFVRGEVNLPTREVISLSRSSVQSSQGGHYIFVVEDGTALRQSIEISDLDALEVEVLSEISTGVKVIVNPKADLRDGMKVEIRKS